MNSSRSSGIVKEVNDALLLLNFAIETGVRSNDGLPLSEEIVCTINTTAAKLGLLDSVSEKAGNISSKEWIAFELAYYQLAQALSPVTAETLRNTVTRPHLERTFIEHIIGDSLAIRFRRLLDLIFIIVFEFILYANWYLSVVSTLPEMESRYRGKILFFQLLLPSAYGALGACVHLLRSTRPFIYRRTFDSRRRTEYLNRIVLGLFAGGIVVLFFNQIVDKNSTSAQVSAAALAFLAGYNTEWLFGALERISEAIFPRHGTDQSAKTPPITQNVNIDALAERLAKALESRKEP